MEYSLHPVLEKTVLPVEKVVLPLTATKLRRVLFKASTAPEKPVAKTATILSRKGVLRNACVLCELAGGFYVAGVDERTETGLTLTVAYLHNHPFAIFECKRVGVEEGMKKGPQTIEKAKQGAYVARSVSALQKIRLRDGSVGGVIQRSNGQLYHGPYHKLLREVVESSEQELLANFILTVGIVSNHGNWFTAEDYNKELKVLAQSYDWLLFLSDKGLAEFINELLLKPTPQLKPARDAFLASYPTGKGNRFTKKTMDVEADVVLKKYFQENEARVDSWFDVISPVGSNLRLLQKELLTLHKKDWKKIYSV